MNVNNWNSKFFIHHTKFLVKNLKHLVYMKVDRTGFYVITDNRTIKFYIGYNGRSNEFMLITDVNKNELIAYHYSEDSEVIFQKVKQILRI